MIKVQQTHSIPLSPSKFYDLVDMLRQLETKNSQTMLELEEVALEIDASMVAMEEDKDGLAQAHAAMVQEDRRRVRRKNPFEVKEETDEFGEFRQEVGGENFLSVILDVVSWLSMGYEGLRGAARSIRPESLLLARRETDKSWLSTMSFQTLEQVTMEMSMNAEAVNRFVQGVRVAESARAAIVGLGAQLNHRLDRYYGMLLKRHSSDGVQIHGDPVKTDLAISIFDNIDSAGEIEDGKNENEISAYSARKAEIVAQAVRTGLLAKFCEDPEELIDYLVVHMKVLWKHSNHLIAVVKPFSDKLRLIMGPSLARPHSITDAQFDAGLAYLKDLDPQSITYREKTGLLTAEERFALNFKNETLKGMMVYLGAGSSTSQLIGYVLQRKRELRDYFRDENSFYVCRVGSGNAFLGAAPGELEIVPGTRPNVDLSEIIGSGFDEVRAFINTVEMSAAWHELFLATSPSKTADKSNVLLIGPQGAGKSEILRAVGGDKKSIGVFATGSDFLTCWKGEAEKNPKRLFEASNKLQKESKKHVHILIDEVDTILNKETGRESFGSTNLVTEFQNLMDGVVHYPNLSVWGATNHPDRIPMTMIRRFSKVLIVGELTQEDRIQLLKLFTSYMPTDDMHEKVWGLHAQRLEGATGDVIRKVVDHIWREKMTEFVGKYPGEAKKFRLFLQKKEDEKSAGEAFALDKFLKDPDHRAEFQKRLSKYVKVTDMDIRRSVDLHLESVAIRSEIDTAVETYAKAKALISSLRSRRESGAGS